VGRRDRHPTLADSKEKEAEMGKVGTVRPSPAIVVAVLSLIAALGGTAIAGTEATTSALTKSKVKKIAKKQIKKLAPSLSVATANTAQNAANADALGGDAPSAFRTGAAFTELSGQPDLTTTEENIITAAITIEEPKTVVAVATIEAEAQAAGVHRVGCLMNIAGAEHRDVFADTIPPTMDADETTLTVNFSRALPAGTHDVALRCRMISGSDLFVEDGWLSVWAVG
jgi:hypothetical protein